MRVLVLGGTGEAQALARRLVASGVDVITSLAGVVAQPRLPPGRVRVGPFGGVEELASYLAGQGVDRVVDATHPFASAITRLAHDACAHGGIPLLRVQRPPWLPTSEDRWIHTRNVQAAAAVARKGNWSGQILLTIGRTELYAFADDSEHRFVARSIEPPCGLSPPHMTLLTQRGPFHLDGEKDVMRRYDVGLLITKNSGGTSTAAKLMAARELKLPVIMIERPALPPVALVDSVDAALSWLAGKPA